MGVPSWRVGSPSRPRRTVSGPAVQAGIMSAEMVTAGNYSRPATLSVARPVAAWVAGHGYQSLEVWPIIPAVLDPLRSLQTLWAGFV